MFLHVRTEAPSISGPECIKCPPAVFQKASIQTLICLQDTCKKKKKKQHAYTASNKRSITRSFKRKWLLVALVSTASLLSFWRFSAAVNKEWQCLYSKHFPHTFQSCIFTEAFSGISSLWQDMEKKKGGGGEGKGQRKALHNQDVTLMFTMGKSNRQPGISRQPLPMFHQHIKTAHIWDTVSIPCGGHFKQKRSQLPGAAATRRHPECGHCPLRGAEKQGPSSRRSDVAQKLASWGWRHKYGTSAEQVADFLVQVAEEVHIRRAQISMPIFHKELPEHQLHLVPLAHQCQPHTALPFHAYSGYDVPYTSGDRCVQL